MTSLKMRKRQKATKDTFEGELSKPPTQAFLYTLQPEDLTALDVACATLLS